MPDDITAEWREYLDKQACTELVFRLARSIDRRDASLLRSLFHTDATDDHGMFQGTAADFIPWVMDVLATMKRTQHCVSNVLIEVHGDIAYGESYFLAHHQIPAENQPDTFMMAAGRYLDRFERRDGVWKIAHRHAAYDWNSQSPSTDFFDRDGLKDWTFGSPSAADPSYMHFKGQLGPGRSA